MAIPALQTVKPRSQADLTLRLAGEDDARVIATLSRELIESGLGWSWTPSRVLRAIRDPDTLTLVACDGPLIIGFAIMQFATDRAHLSLLAVRKLQQRRGVGRRMVEWLEASARIAGIARVHLELRVNNHAARAFYADIGFAETAQVPGYYRGVETAVRMVRVLRTHSELPPFPELG